MTLWDQRATGACGISGAGARLHEGATAPNPAVGGVLLDAAGTVLIALAHPGAGQPHAEARAIAMAREAGVADRIHTVIVTLEPCHHHGRTGPCTAANLLCIDGRASPPARILQASLKRPRSVASGYPAWRGTGPRGGVPVSNRHRCADRRWSRGGGCAPRCQR